MTRELARQAVREGTGAKAASELCRTWLVSIPTPKGLPAYSVTVVTPYCEAAVLAFKAAQRHEALDAEKMPIPTEDQQSVILQAGPIGRPETDFRLQRASPPRVLGVGRMMLRRRGEETILPVKSAFHDVAVSVVNGLMQTVKAGSFVFPLSALGSGKEPVTITVLPDTGTTRGEATTVLTPEDLRTIDRTAVSRS